MAVAASLALRWSPGMKQLCCSCLLWFGLLQAAFSWEEMENRPRKLCGKHLLSQIIKLCGQTDWTQFEIDEQTSLGHIPHQSSHPPKTLKPEQIPSSSAWRKFTHPGKTLNGGWVFALHCALLRLDFAPPLSFCGK